MDDGKDFTSDLAELQSAIRVDDILAVLKRPKASSSAAPEAAVPAVRRPLRKVPDERRNEPPKTLARESRPGLVNVTTRLTPETNELLTRIALERRLQGHKPDTRQEVIEAAVREFAKRHGHVRREPPRARAADVE